MTYLHLNKWSGQVGADGVVARIRRKISGALANGETVLVFDDIPGMTEDIRSKIRAGWPTTKVRFSYTHPSAATTPTKKERRARRPRL